MRVLVTRPKEDSTALQQELHRRGVEAQLDPMLVIERMEDVAIDLEGAQGLLFTSSNGIRAFANLTDERDLPAYCVGDETARACRSANFTNVHSAEGDVDTLANYVTAHSRPGNGRMIHVAGSVNAGDLAGTLRATGFSVDRIPLYNAVPATSLTADTKNAFRQGLLDGVLFFSPRTAATFVSLAKAAGLENACRTVDAYCLSAGVAQRVGVLPWRRIVVAAEPTRAALLATLGQG
ncbi:MAG: uroporphyrinogen-III synthase [Proteobacteria bacterium]|nr:uroporphyrinogen-III synthase [Pseudomonadota bacterium]MCK4866606.1 uroporphyrinogen-III synthase [Alphaproteobacteria bacterium]